jgi:hypothetical protein
MACLSSDIETAATLLLEVAYLHPAVSRVDLGMLAPAVAAATAYVRKLQVLPRVEPYKITTARAKRDAINHEIRGLVTPCERIPVILYPLTDHGVEIPRIGFWEPDGVTGAPPGNQAPWSATT